MILRVTRFLFTSVWVMSIAAAAAPIATISSASAFELRGKQVITNGVPSWPVMAGDEIGTSAGPATIQYRDGSRVTLNANSKAKAEQTSEGVVFRLLSGTMEFTLAPKAKVVFYNGAKVLNAQAGVATVASTTSITQLQPVRVLPPPPPPQSGR